jgi:hypothetical protein
MAIQLDQGVQVAILPHLRKVGVPLVCERASYIGRRRRADHNYGPGIELKGPLHLPILGMK